jgi:hypothetical protein
VDERDAKAARVAAWIAAAARSPRGGLRISASTPNSRALHLIAVLPPAEALPRLSNDGAACSGSGAARA